MGWAVIDDGFTYPSTPRVAVGSAENQATIDATGEKFAWIGRVWMPERGTRNISKVHFKFGSVITKAGGSALTLSLQDVSTTTLYAPDEVQDQTAAISNANIPAASTWYTATLGSTRTVTDGDMLAVVIEFDGAGRLGADSVRFPGRTGLAEPRYSDCIWSLKTGGTWAIANASRYDIFPCAFEFDDGTFGCMREAPPWHNETSVNYNSSSSPDEYGNSFTVDFPCLCDGIYASILVTAPADFELCLYQGTTLLASASVDSSQIEPLVRQRRVRFSSAVTLKPGVTYTCSFKPITTTNVGGAYTEITNTSFWPLMPGGDNFKYVTRTDGGAWSTPSTTRRFKIGIMISGILDGHNVSGLQSIEQGVSR